MHVTCFIFSYVCRIIDRLFLSSIVTYLSILKLVKHYPLQQLELEVEGVLAAPVCKLEGFFAYETP